MSNITRDLYTGFEGQPELVIEHQVKGVVHSAIHAWIAYFDRLIDSVSTEPGGWRGIVRLHQINTAWNIGVWTDPSPAETLEIVEKAYRSTDNERVRSLAEALMEMYTRAQSEGGDLVWRVD